MTCDWVRNKLSGFLDCELPEEEHIAVSNHLSQCPDCEREMKEISRLKDMLGTIKGDMPEEVRRSVTPMLDSLRGGLLLSRIRECIFIAVVTMGIVIVFLLVVSRYHNYRDITTRLIEPYKNLHRSVSGQQLEPVRSSASFEITPVDYPVFPAETPAGED